MNSSGRVARGSKRIASPLSETPHQAEGETARASLELLYHISRELASALDLSTLLQRVLFLSIQYVGAINGSIIVLDDAGQPVDAAIVVGGRTEVNVAGRLRVIFEHGLAGWVAGQGQAVLIPDTSQDERWLRRPDDAEDRTGPKSAVSAPILVREQLVGVVTLVHPTPGFFNSDHLSLIQSIADQAGIAILNARLYAESRRQAQVMTAVAESAMAITASLEVEQILARILQQTSQALEVEAVSLALVEAASGDLVYRASTLPKVQLVRGVSRPGPGGVARWVLTHDTGVIVTEPQHDPRFASEMEQRYPFEIHAIACAPIRLEGQVIGVLEAINPFAGVFDAEALLVLTGIGSMAGSAIRHGQLYADLEAAHRHYRELFEDNIDPILISDCAGLILEMNHQAELSIRQPQSRLKGMSIEALNVVDRAQVGEHFEKLSSGKTISYEANLQFEVGDLPMPVDVYARQMLAGEETRIQWILHDLTARKNLDTLREELSGMIYHDLRSPLANIVSSLDVMASMIPEKDELELQPLLAIARRATDRILRLTNSLLDINRIEAGQEVGTRRAHLPNQLIQEAMEAVAAPAEYRGVQLVQEKMDSLPEVWVDADMIRRVLINLIENAIKFTPAKGKICVGARQEGSAVQFWVRDSGPGIAVSDQQRIFEKFTRLSSNEGSTGLGLGLAYCRLAVQAHGGRIWVNSQPGSGAAFFFMLPIAPQASGAG